MLGGVITNLRNFQEVEERALGNCCALMHPMTTGLIPLLVKTPLGTLALTVPVKNGRISLKNCISHTSGDLIRTIPDPISESHHVLLYSEVKDRTAFCYFNSSARLHRFIGLKIDERQPETYAFAVPACSHAGCFFLPRASLPSNLDVIYSEGMLLVIKAMFCDTFYLEKLRISRVL